MAVPGSMGKTSKVSQPPVPTSKTKKARRRRFLERRTRASEKTSYEVATERLSTPDQLDQVIRVARFPHWLALAALFLVLGTAIAGSILVPVPVTVRGQGILINAEGILNVTSNTQGRLLGLYVEPGRLVEAGELVARIDQPQLWQDLRNHRAELLELRRRRDTIRAFHQRKSTSQNETLADRRHALEERQAFAAEHLRLMEEQLADELKLQRQGIISERQVTTSRRRVNEARQNLTSIDNELRFHRQLILDSELEQERELLDIELELSDLKRVVDSLDERYRRHSEVKSPYTGRVVELSINVGEIVNTNGLLFSLLPTDSTELDSGSSLESGELIAVIYVPPSDGKKVRPGMDVQLELTPVKREEFGFMLGTVESVAEVPSTTIGMMRILKNRQLVDQLSGTQAPFEVRVALRRDGTTHTRYQWSSSTGPEVEINVGTLCVGDVITKRERPVTLLIPAMGRFFDD